MFQRLNQMFGRNKVIIFFALIAILIIAGFVVNQSTPDEEEAVAVTPTVAVSRVSDLAVLNSQTLIGTVEALDEANIETEASGRVVRVNVELGDTVAAGAVLAELENASEYAAVLQAEGSYEAALASAAQSDVSVSEAETALQNAKNTAVSAYRSAFTTFRSVLLNDVDDVFANPTGQVPGVRVSGGDTTYLNETRVRFQSVITDWQQDVQSITVDSNLEILLDEAIAHTNDLIDMVDALHTITSNESSAGSLSKEELATLSSTFATDRTTLNSTLSTLDTAVNSLQSTGEALRRAQIGGTNTDLSSANAQVKQALGALRAAEANLAKTVIRTPIAGTVNTLAIRSGEYVAMAAPVAVVANNNSLIIRTYVGEQDRDRLTVGQTVALEQGLTGTVTAIAPGVDPTTKKYEVKIAAESDKLVSGDTVTVTVDSSTAPETAEPERIVLPITAIKFSSTNGVVFTVEDGKLVSHPVTVGSVIGGTIEVLEGVTSDMQIVIDARGLSEGESVEAK